MNELVSKEIAILAKQKGFDDRCNSHFDQQGPYFSSYARNSEHRHGQITIPTRTQLQNHLRERGVEVWASIYTYIGETDGTYSGFVYKDGKWIDDTVDFPTFQDAFDWALIEELKTL